MAEEKKKIGTSHRVSLVERESVAVDGVNNVESFDDQEVVLDTAAGMLVIRGKELHIKQLNLDEGNLAIEGYVQGLEYSDDGVGRKGKGIIGRLLK